MIDVRRLPPELWILIASFVRKSTDLATLCIVSKTFMDFCTPMLYQTIDFHRVPPKLATQRRLYQTLRDTRLSNLVTDLSVSLDRTAICDKHSDEYKGLLPPFARSCTCGVHDLYLGNAIEALSNLKSLRIKCKLCHYGHAHGYLFHSNLSRLCRFGFHCFNTGKFTINSNKSFLLAPLMLNLTSLALECHSAMTTPSLSVTHQELIEQANFAPGLNTLQHNGQHLSNSVLARRPIQRLCLDSSTHHVHGAYTAALQPAIWKSPGILSHLFSVDLLQWLPKAVMDDLEPYRNLKFIGTITGSHCEEDTAFQEMDVLAPLGQLEAIEINQFRAEEGYQIPLMLATGVLFSPTRGFLGLLEGQHPLLRRVLLIARREIYLGPGDGGPIPVLWEKILSWESHPAPYVEYWDILNGKLGD